MNIMSDPLALRALLKQEDGPDIHFELRRISRFEFTAVENGKAGPLWKAFTPQELINGNCPPAMGIWEAWQSCMVHRFPGYVATAIEELSQDRTVAAGAI